MVGGAIALQRLDPLIMVVDGGQGGAARCDVGEAARAGLADGQHRTLRHRIIAIEAVADRDAFGRAFGHGRKTPYRQAPGLAPPGEEIPIRSEEHTYELQSLMRHSDAVFYMKKN